MAVDDDRARVGAFLFFCPHNTTAFAATIPLPHSSTLNIRGECPFFVVFFAFLIPGHVEGRSN
jgi:hypothetical protein